MHNALIERNFYRVYRRKIMLQPLFTRIESAWTNFNALQDNPQHISDDKKGRNVISMHGKIFSIKKLT